MTDSMQKPPSELERMRKLRRYARLLDASVGLPGTKLRVGVDSLVGLIPGVGDALGAALSAPILYHAWRSNVSSRTLRRMLVNVALESLVGVVPIVGDLFDAFFKANQRNVALLEEEIGARDARLPVAEASD